jgi:hypothetical protein
MKSIKQQYIDLREGNMTQANFMRNLRMTLPQYVTNLSSFEDSLRILKNKGILTEADIKMAEPEEKTLPKITPAEEETDNEETTDDVNISFDVSTGEITSNRDDYHRDGFTMGYFEESLNEAKDESGKWTNADGKSMYDQFKEINRLNAQEVLIGIDYEMEKNEELTKAEAQKIVIKNLKKNQFYYTNQDMSDVEGFEPGYIGGKSANAEARQMQPLEKNMGNVVDKKMGMQPVKDVEKPKKDSDKGGETNKAVKGIDLMSLIAKTVRGMKKMDATGEKMKKVSVKENHEKINLNNLKMSDQAARAKKIHDEEEKKRKEKNSKLKELIRKEIQEMYDGMEPMNRTGLDETKLFADFSVESESDNSIKSRFARSMSEVAREYDHLDNIEIPRFFDEYENGDTFYAGPTESLRFFQTLPKEFVVTNNMNNVDESFMITKTGDDSFIAKEI